MKQKKQPNFQAWLKEFLSNNEKNAKEKPTKKQYLMLIFAAGIAFMLLGNFFGTDANNKNALPVMKPDETEGEAAVFKQDSGTPSSMIDYENRYENQLREVLENIIGVNDVTVMVNLDSTKAKVFQKNITAQSQSTDETDREGGKRKVEDRSRDEQVVILRNGDKEQPLVVKTMKPEIRGVLIVAQGVDNLKVKQMVVEAVTRVLDVPSHHVSVLPKKSKGE